jgi:hypothetical protein
MLQHPRGLWIRAFRSIDRARCLPPKEVRAGHASVLLAPFDVAFAALLRAAIAAGYAPGVGRVDGARVDDQQHAAFEAGVCISCHAPDLLPVDAFFLQAMSSCKLFSKHWTAAVMIEYDEQLQEPHQAVSDDHDAKH